MALRDGSTQDGTLENSPSRERRAAAEVVVRVQPVRFDGEEDVEVGDKRMKNVLHGPNDRCGRRFASSVVALLSSLRQARHEIHASREALWGGRRSFVMGEFDTLWFDEDGLA